MEVGEVTHVQKGQVTYRLSNSIAYQDVLEFRDKNGEKQYEYTVKDGAEPPAEISARYQKGCVIKPGQKVFRTKNSMLLEEINEEISYAKVADIQLELYEAKKAKAEIEKDIAKMDEKIEYLQREAHKAVKEAREYEKRKGITREV